MRMDNDFPLFFKLWLAFVALFAISAFGFAAWIAIKVIFDPSLVGEMAGRVVNGFMEEVQ